MYHIESVVEMQLMAIITMMCMNYTVTQDENNERDFTLEFIVYCYFFEHILSYLIFIYRKRDLARNGKPDSYGVIRAKNEYLAQIG
jgi:hypothetical protein